MTDTYMNLDLNHLSSANDPCGDDQTDPAFEQQA